MSELNFKQALALLLIASLLIGAALVLISWAVSLTKSDAQQKLSGLAPGLEAELATSSQATLVGGSVSTLIATSSSCANRVVTTKASPVVLTFSESRGESPSGAYGHLQAASTTITYAAEEFGCDKVKALSADGGTVTLTISEFR